MTFVNVSNVIVISNYGNSYFFIRKCWDVGKLGGKNIYIYIQLKKYSIKK